VIVIAIIIINDLAALTKQYETNSVLSLQEEKHFISFLIKLK